MSLKPPGYPAIKRAGDILASSMALIATAPLQLGIAVTIRATLGRPVLFRQKRPGLHGELFTLTKFRTMIDIDPKCGLTDDASRLTSLGRFLRSTSLDELPTLWNVLRGDMSIVGPRPLLETYLPLYSTRQATRHDVKPGITGLAQVNGRNNLDWADRLELDAQYVEQASAGLDARILAATVGTVFRREGISADGHATMAHFEGTPPEPSAGD